MARKLNEKTAADAAEKAAGSAPPRTARSTAKKVDADRIKSNLTDETIVAAIMECGGFKAELETAQGKYRNALKKWEERGVDAGDIVWILKTKKRELHDLENEIRRRNRLLRVLKIPVGAQLGLFEDGESVGSKVDRDEIDRQKEEARAANAGDIAKAQAKGLAAGLKDYGPETNPFPDGSPEFLAWEAGRKNGIEQRRNAGAEVTESAAPEAADAS